MKSGLTYFFVLAFMLGFIGLASAEQCALELSLLNQDPYPAVPGEYVKLVLSVDGLNNAECGDVYVELVNNFPISFDSGIKNNVILQSGAYVSDYQNYALIPFKVKIDENAINDEYELDVRYTYNYHKGDKSFITKKINLTVQDSNTVFEVSVKDYDYVKKVLTFDIINVGDQDVNALTVDMEKQDSFVSKGTTRAIVGGLDYNDDTSFSFIGVPSSGSISLKIGYNDAQNIRRYIIEKTTFDESLFVDKSLALVKPNYTLYIIGVVIIIIVFLVIRSTIRKRRKLEQLKNRKN